MAEQLRAPIVVLTPTSNTSINVYCDTPSYPIGMIPPIPSGSIIQRSNTSDFASPTEIYNGAEVVFDDTGLTNGNTYYYRAKFKGDGTSYTDSNWSDIVSKTLDPGTKLATPTIDILSVTGGSIQFRINNVTNGVRGEVWRDTASDFSNAWFLVEGDLPIVWNDYYLNPNTTYYYRARALGHDDIYFTSDWATANATTPNQLAAPLLSSDGSTDNSIDITIQAVPNGANYQLERSSDSAFSSPVVIYTGPAAEFTDTGLEAESTYYYRAKALANGGFTASDYGPVFSLVTDPEFKNYGLKYEIGFGDVIGKSFSVKMFLLGWSAGVTELTGSDTPVIIKYSGDDSDVYDPIRDFKATINILMPKFVEGFYEEITGINDKDYWVEITDISSGFKYSGWLIPDEFARPFDETIYQISLTVVSPFSLMKGVELLTREGRMYFGPQKLSDMVNSCISLTIPDDHAVSYTINSVLKEKDFVGSADLFAQLMVNIESFNDKNGRPPKCYEFIEKICTSFGFYCIWENGVLKFFDLYNDSRIGKNVIIKSAANDTNFLILNDENITKSRAAKEVGLTYKYGEQTGLLEDGRFLDYSGVKYNRWTYENIYRTDNSVIKYIYDGNVNRRGTGRKVDPHRVRFSGYTDTNHIPIYSQETKRKQGFYASAPVQKGDNLSIKIEFKYFDYRKDYPSIPLDTAPIFIFTLAIMPTVSPSASNTYTFISAQDADKTERVPSMQETYGDTYETWVNTGESNRGTFPIWVAMGSLPSIQTYERELGKSPIDGEIVVMLFGMSNDFAPSITGNDLYVDVLDVIISKDVIDVQKGTKVTGEEVYITQKTTSSLIEEPKEIFLTTEQNKYLSTSILKLNKEASQGFSRGSESDAAQNWLARSMMAQRRSPRHKIDCSISSNSIRMSDVVKFKNGGDDLLPNKYMIGSYEYNVKMAELKTTAFEINTQDRPLVSASEDFQQPTETTDMLENYKLYE